MQRVSIKQYDRPVFAPAYASQSFFAPHLRVGYPRMPKNSQSLLSATQSTLPIRTGDSEFSLKVCPACG